MKQTGDPGDLKVSLTDEEPSNNSVGVIHGYQKTNKRQCQKCELHFSGIVCFKPSPTKS